ncbi:MAG: hypothetical protein ACKVOH_00545 [Chlamydiales bacterium]
MESFLVPIIERRRLNEGSPEKETFHVILDLSQTPITYKVGDCVAIYPENDPALVQKIVGALGATGEESIHNRKGESKILRSFLTKNVNLLRVPKKLGSGEHILACIEENRPDLDTFCSLLSPMLPRFYSIASSMAAVGKKVELTITLNRNPSHFPLPYGTCTDYLCRRAPLFTPCINLYLHPSETFFLSKKSFDTPIIMIGPGTGVAPFRGFMQERIKRNMGQNWLFFGEQHKQFDYYYKEEWTTLEKKGLLTVDTAFSRDGPEKVYVQHKMLMKSRSLWEWIEKGAHIYVCGDAQYMAKAVDKTLHSIIESEGGMSPSDAKTYIKNLKLHHRYLRDVY